MPIFRNTHDFIKILDARIQYALKLTQQEIYEVIQRHITDYYKEKAFKGGTSAIPSVYERTYKFLSSLIKTEIINDNGNISCNVEINEKYLNYHYHGKSVSGLNVATWANESSHEHTHGGTVAGYSSFWDDAINELGGKQGIYNLMAKNLKKVGIPIK